MKLHYGLAYTSSMQRLCQLAVCCLFIFFLISQSVQAGLVLVPYEGGMVEVDDETFTSVIVCAEGYPNPTNPAGLILSISCVTTIPEGYIVIGAGESVQDPANPEYTHTRYQIVRAPKGLVEDSEDEPPPRAAGSGIVSSGRDGDFGPDGYGSCEFVATVNNLIRFLVGITGILAVIAFMYAGFVMVVSAGNTAMIEQAKNVFANVLIGFVILLSAFLVINTIMNMLIGNEEGLVNWNQVECSYSKQAGELNTDPIIAAEEEFVTPEIFNKQGWTVINRYTQIRTVTSGAASGFDSGGFISAGGGYSSGGAAAGSCAVIRDSNNFCSVSKLRGFGSQAEAASRICNLESGGGQSAIISGTDLCETGHSFSGGLFQINILANNRFIPGCSSDFFETKGSSAQGSCLRQAVNSAGTPYCAVRNCAIKDENMYNHCMSTIMNPRTNLEIALQLYRAAGGFSPWLTSARVCNLM